MLGGGEDNLEPSLQDSVSSHGRELADFSSPTFSLKVTLHYFRMCWKHIQSLPGLVFETPPCFLLVNL